MNDKSHARKISRREMLRLTALTGAGLIATQCVMPATPAPEAKEASEKQEEAAPKKITVTYMASGTYDKAAEDLGKRFTEEMGVEVQVAAFPWSVLRQNNTNDLLSGAGQYDVVSGGWYLADVFPFMEPLDDYIKKDNYGQGLIPGLMDPGKSWYYKGKQVGVPFGIDAYGLLYRTDIFEEAGIEPSFGTWDDVLEGNKKLADHLKGTDISPHVFAYGGNEQTTNLIIAEYSGTYINEDGKYEFEFDEAVRVFKLIKELLPYAPENALALSIDEANAVFLDGKAAMMPCWPSFVRAAADNPDQSKVVGKWAQMPYPGRGIPSLSLWNLFISQASDNKDLAWEWVKAYTSEEFDEYMLDTYGIGSVWASTYTDPEFLEKRGYDFGAAFENYKRANNIPLSGEAFDFFTGKLNEFMTGQIDAETAINDINEKWATLTVPEVLAEFSMSAGFTAK